jgi:hypothetical protein
MTIKQELYGPARVGGDALSWCTKCRMDLAHVIVSMVDGKPSKVECKTCRSVHRYKLGGTATPRKTRTTATKTVVRASEVWEQKLAQKTKAEIAPYKTNPSFGKGDVIQHPSFGVGIVEEVRSTNKIAVFFRDGEKLLVHGIGA